jgi:hypothetical protein
VSWVYGRGEGAAVDLCDEPLETVHTATCGLRYVGLRHPVVLENAVVVGG